MHCIGKIFITMFLLVIFLDLLESTPSSKLASINEGASDIKRTVQLNFNSVFDIYMDRPTPEQELLLVYKKILMSPRFYIKDNFRCVGKRNLFRNDTLLG